MKRQSTCAVVLALTLLGLLVLPVAGELDPEPHYASYYLYLDDDHPDNADTQWSEDVQGITHDHDSWYISQTTSLWQVPVGHDLNDPVCLQWYMVECLELIPGGVLKRLWHYPELSDYNHFGDPTYYEGYLVVPLEGEDATPAIAFFDVDAALDYVDHIELPFQSDAPWVAVDPVSGNLYTSLFETQTLHRCTVDWATLDLLEGPDVIPLRNEAGGALWLDAVQGGVFTQDGQILYLVSDGIHAFDGETWQRIRESSKSDMPFKYEFDPDLLTGEEPEGLTIWDLDDGRAPGIRGTLHVLLLDNNPLSPDLVFLKHYTESIYVDASHSGEEQGTPQKPFDSVVEAYDMAWDGQRIRIRSGSYPEALTFSKRLEVLSIDGPATIGE